MRKLIKICLSIILYICLIVSCNNITFDDFEYKYTPPEYIEMPVVKHPFEIFEWIKINMKYFSDKRDEWQAPHVSIERKLGDCEDPVILAMYYLDEYGYEPYLITIKVKNEDALHAILEIDKYTWINFTVTADYYFYPIFLIPEETFKEYKRHSWQDILIRCYFKW